LLRFHQNRFEEAEADYNRAIELDPTNDGTLNNRGYLFFMTNQFDKALSDYNRAIAIRQKPLYFKNRSDVLFKLGRHSEADEDLNRAK
jgi:tetratricopeptide (TPR) repeat protein